MDCIVLGVAKSQTPLSDFHFHFSLSIIFTYELTSLLRVSVLALHINHRSFKTVWSRCPSTFVLLLPHILLPCLKILTIYFLKIFIYLAVLGLNFAI